MQHTHDLNKPFFSNSLMDFVTLPLLSVFGWSFHNGYRTQNISCFVKRPVMHLAGEPTARILPPLIPAFRNTDLILSETAFHHSDGFCFRPAAEPLVCQTYAAMMRPQLHHRVLSIDNPLLDVMDMSMPRKYCFVIESTSSDKSQKFSIYIPCHCGALLMGTQAEVR